MAANASRTAPGWRQIERDLAQRLAAKQGTGTARERPSDPPDSGIRTSGQVDVAVAPLAMPARPLTYSVYTVSEHDVSAATSRSSLPPIASEATPPTWADARRSLRDRKVLVAVVRRLPWRRLGVVLAVTGSAFLVFLFAVVTVAELTDDLKPARRTSGARGTAAMVLPSLPVAVVPAPVAVAAVEVDEAPPPPPVKKAPAKAKARPKAKAKKTPIERFLP